jgi:RNA polymerase sigma-70 factor (ECF subfamily)
MAARADDELFEQLLERHYRPAYNVAYRLAGNHADAEDLVQDAMIRAFQSFARYRRDLPFANWLYRIIHNLYIDRLRRRPKARIESLDEDPSATEIPDAEADPARSVLDRQVDRAIQKALAGVTSEFRMAVILCDIQGFSYEEIAEIMGCSLGTVRSRVHRGRKQLRARMDAVGATVE